MKEKANDFLLIGITLASILIGLLFGVCSCTFSFNLVHSQGSGSDMIDETQTPTNSATAAIPGI